MDHAQSIRHFYDLINAGDIDGFGRLLADDFAEREPLPGFPPTRAGVIGYFKMLVAAFPDMRMTPDDVIVSGDKAVARVRVTGTHQGEFMGMPPSGRRVEAQLIDIIRFGDDGRAREHWGVVDQLTMMQQLGAIPSQPPA
ncbi:MAG: ester cyclase [Vicinamibacterales bacterium]